MKKRFLILFLIFAMAISCAGCGSDDYEASSFRSASSAETDIHSTSTAAEDSSGNPEDTWAVYWYICGSDLESEDGSATDDIIEMEAVTLPENVTVVLETGGASYWMNDMISADTLGRYVYNSDGFSELEQLDNANMGDPDTLSDFITYCSENYNADHKLLIFWNHGGGSVGGVAYDENYDFDSLTLSEIGSALEASASEKMFDLIGFDTCLMATLDTAATVEQYADYLVASEESEPGTGWYYSGWLETLAEDTGISAAALGTSICDTFMESCREYDTDDTATLSVIDLAKINEVRSNVDDFGVSLLSAASENSGTLSTFAREAAASQNFGGNSRASGYTNMVDLGDLAEKAGDLAGESAALVESSIADAVVYQVCGDVEQSATGLSIYYPLDNDESGVSEYDACAASDVYECLLTYLVTGWLPDDTQEIVEQAMADDAQEAETEAEAGEEPAVPDIDYDNAPVIEPYDGSYTLDIDDEGNLSLAIDASQLDSIASVTFGLYYFYDEETDDVLELGWDDDLVGDWDTGVFHDNFRGVWGSLNDCLCYMELMSEGDDCNTYCVPVTINDEYYYLLVAWYYDSGEYEVLGARQELDEETGMADKNLYQPQPGDEVIPILYTMDEYGEEEEAYIDVITVGGDGLTFVETDLPVGEYAYCFCIEDLQGNYTYTDYANFFYDEDGYVQISIG